MASAPPPALPQATQQRHWTTVTAYGDIGELSYLPLDPARIEQSVRSEKDGAVVSFVGYTRDNFQGRTVTHLTYESYVPLALKTLHHLLLEARDLPPPPPLPGIEPHSCASHLPPSASSSSSSGEPAKKKIELGRIHVAHLLGPSPPLTPSIVITVSSPHRREAFYAAEWMLEMVKRRVQVWKREWYAAEERSEGEGRAGGVEEGEGLGEREGEVFVGRDGEGPDGFGGRAHERHVDGGGGGTGGAGSSKWKENFPLSAPASASAAQRSAGGADGARPAVVEEAGDVGRDVGAVAAGNAARETL